MKKKPYKKSSEEKKSDSFYINPYDLNEISGHFPLKHETPSTRKFRKGMDPYCASD